MRRRRSGHSTQAAAAPPEFLRQGSPRIRGGTSAPSAVPSLGCAGGGPARPAGPSPAESRPASYPKALAVGFGGSDTSPNTDSWDRADDDDNALGCTIDIVTRVIYGNDMKEYGFYRPFQIDSAGCIRKIGPETKYAIQS